MKEWKGANGSKAFLKFKLQLATTCLLKRPQTSKTKDTNQQTEKKMAKKGFSSSLSPSLVNVCSQLWFVFEKKTSQTSQFKDGKMLSLAACQTTFNDLVSRK